MKTTGEIMRRAWEKNPTKFPWRAVDRNGRSYYYEKRPRLSISIWHPGWHFFGNYYRRGGDIDKGWAIDNWDRTLQHYTTFQKFIIT